MVRVKVCGITSKEDALLAVKLGVHALGFIFAPSPRLVTPEVVRSIICDLPPLVQTIGVFVNENPDRIKEIMRFCGLDMVQLHGDESPEICEGLMPLTIKAIRLRNESILEETGAFFGKVRALLFDTYSEEKRGGTGKALDWDLAVRAKQAGMPIILAGGLNPANIEDSILAVRPFAVDVNSEVEERPGKKSPLLMKELMEKIRRINGRGMLYD
ncbi:MAG: phosphoribosylanthranilate isomerase [Deltaproteobacteria bacterium]|nr:phosphoribosylanthranilate isomerase [Deltaproteobacteria bacterium]MBW1910655.1 phosphoribosylanthranilate isomerase [Deltaproteobacteria bacterium]MBW2034871.1 phosphoribosylanthranilate isomerase [Deltaproteobacteria bacterium]MBW2115711.1 phosphoribosylanthranilate isomerase [Deltaproteobacteria bacterium]